MIRLLRLSSVIDRTGLSKSSIYKQIQEHAFPSQVRIGDRAVAWLESDIDRWIGSCTSSAKDLSADKQTELNDAI
ncbi:MAG TPA: AlpA family transcriptional regulator [Arenicellales bacterium]|nr:AlpA family transcriptional regulator [Arenicellales bacterium]